LRARPERSAGGHRSPVWLFKASRFAVGDALKRRGACAIASIVSRILQTAKASDGATADAASMSDDISQTLDEAVSCLGDADHQAVLLRFYEGKSLADVGAIMGTSEEAAKKRVSRAVDKLRKYFANRGVIASVALVLLLLSQRSDAAGAVPAIVAPPPRPPSPTRSPMALSIDGQCPREAAGRDFRRGLALLISLPALSGAFPRRDAHSIAVAPPTVQPLPEIPLKPSRLPRPNFPSRLVLPTSDQL